MADLNSIETKITPLLEKEGLKLDKTHQPESGKVFAIDIQTMPGKNPREVGDLLDELRPKLEAVLEGHEPFYVRSLPEGEDGVVIV